MIACAIAHRSAKLIASMGCERMKMFVAGIPSYLREDEAIFEDPEPVPGHPYALVLEGGDKVCSSAAACIKTNTQPLPQLWSAVCREHTNVNCMCWALHMAFLPAVCRRSHACDDLRIGLRCPGLVLDCLCSLQ